jgi:hypothetical protein
VNASADKTSDFIVDCRALMLDEMIGICMKWKERLMEFKFRDTKDSESCKALNLGRLLRRYRTFRTLRPGELMKELALLVCSVECSKWNFVRTGGVITEGL